MRTTLSLRQTGFELLEGRPGGSLQGPQKTSWGRAGGGLGVDKVVEGEGIRGEGDRGWSPE